MIDIVWIVEQNTPCNILDVLTEGIYILVGANYKPILDKKGKPYRCGSIAQAEQKTVEVLMPYLQHATRSR